MMYAFQNIVEAILDGLIALILIHITMLWFVPHEATKFVGNFQKLG
jgi:uncharacterized membrane protein